ncbi:MAG: TIGR03618 family F420-dependent PPOX class oxidoreductase [Chloroflexi bacterium]|nr:TIGR03618 family F420-dependent PPOX class oxidoreductase [Chloroflexota bacterium]
MDDKVREFLMKHHAAIMATIRKDGQPHVARVTVALVDGKLWSSSTQTRLRTQFLRRDPRATLCVLDEGNAGRWLGLETKVRILDGPDAARQNLALRRVIAGDPPDVEQYLREKIAEQRLIYEFEIVHAYGQY